MRKREQRPIQLDKNDHETLKELAADTGLGMAGVVHRLIGAAMQRVETDQAVPRGCYLGKYALFELIHLKDTGVISAEEFAVLVNNEGAEGIVMDMLWAEDPREKRRILDRYNVLNASFGGTVKR
jgi:hypothetical protein